VSGTPEIDVTKIVRRFYRHKELIIATFVVVSILATYLASILPNVYRSSTVIVVTPQRVPSSFVTSTVTMELSERLQSIVQEILSRAQLLQIVEEFNLYGDSNASIEDRIGLLKKSIKIDFRRTSGPQARPGTALFDMSFEMDNPKKAQQVTARLATLFIDQNVQVREQQALGTKAFINAEAERLRKELEEQEAVVNRYKAAHLYELPEQLDANLRNLEQLRRDLESSNLRLTSLQERKGSLQKQAVESDSLRLELLNSLPGSGGGEGVVNKNVPLDPVLQLDLKRKELSSLQQRYSSKHPDIVRLVREIELLESEIKPSDTSKSENASTAGSSKSVKQVLQNQITDLDSEIAALRAYQERVRGQIRVLESRVDTAPIRAIELSKVSRGYDITLKKYQDLLAKNLESELSENMEKKLKGEQFQILDPANLPSRPVRPNRQMIVVIGILAGLAGGIGLAFVWDTMDASFKTGDEISAYVNTPVLATIPALLTRSSVLEQRRSQSLLIVSSVGALAIGVLLLRRFAPMFL
jgi:polysaccharide chain length determinant protein (PEP-CTERM system associated)